MIEAITFDFWDTIAIDDSDEYKRVQLGLPAKAEARTQLFAEMIGTYYPEVSTEQATVAYHHANQRFNHEWHTEHRTPGVTNRIYYAYEHLGLGPQPGHYARLMGEIDDVVRAIEEMEIRISPEFAPGIQGALQLLSTEYKLGIISDTIHTTGRGLRNLLERQNILHYFDYFVFSDEVGASKPHPRVFREAALGLDVSPSQMIHIGDRESNDIEGPLSAGMKAILYTGIKDRGSYATRAMAVCHDYGYLPQLIRRMD